MLTYECRRAGQPPRLDGQVHPDPTGWDLAPWMEEFGDILGPADAAPKYSTKSKMLYDDEFLYVAAFLEEEHVWGTLVEDQAVIFQDNDFEIFIDIGGRGENYYEFEINALGTTWQLTIDKPYSKGGCARNVQLENLVSAVKVFGTINDPDSSPDQGWSVTVAIPLAGLSQFGDAKIEPGNTVWRANFSRVQWEHRVVDADSGRKVYERIPPHGTHLLQGSNEVHPEQNWTWTPQTEINIHAPETWGFIRFV